MRQCQLRCFQPISCHKVLLPGQTKKSYLSRQEKSVASVFCSKSKENAFFLKPSMRFMKIKKLKKLCSKKWSAGHIFANGKRMLEILQINVWLKVTLQTMDKTVNFLRTVQFSVLGHVTVGVSQ